MSYTIGLVAFLAFATCFGSVGCQRESPTEQVHKPIDEAAETIERPMSRAIEKAKGVEKILQKAADRTATEGQKGGE